MRWVPRVVHARRALLRPIAEFAQAEATSGILLMVCTAAALVWANSAWAAQYFSIWSTEIGIAFGRADLRMSALHWVNDGLMAVFFLLVGLEIKREFLIGELASLRKAALPGLAALGGMVVPALIFAFLNRGEPSVRGWGVPMATDIAFALGVLALLGNRIPFALKVFVTAVAIVDDIGAVLVIAVFYTSELNGALLGLAAGVVAVLLLLNNAGVRSPLAYMVLGTVLWLLFLGSGIHASIAGVVLAMTIPAKVHLDPVGFDKHAREVLGEFERAGAGGPPGMMNEDRQSAVRELERACERVQMPLERIEDVLQPWVAFGIMPLFALANAGVALSGGPSALVHDGVGPGILAGLVLGKPIGIVLFSYAAVRLRLAELPERVDWRHMVGAGILGGIGFTMSLFIAELAFADSDNRTTAKVAILAASATAGLAGYLFLQASGRRAPQAASTAETA